HRHDMIDALATYFAGEKRSEQRRERQLAAELERVHQRIGGKIIGERGMGRIVGGRQGEAPAAHRTAGRLERAARAERLRQARQLGVALRAEQRARSAAADEAAAAEKYARELFSHKL